ncbi:amino acid adenylation domain-containing protein [Anaerosporobacter sp.]|uniref:amino acid adenylation domain-containing protein n=1 Tax=Anaerosporobacter sp. TaxID=1872529 RepID=UPI00286EC51A|nr:amino acid adenylation domain-containing protein [Anaerosporobacter sp.]
MQRNVLEYLEAAVEKWPEKIAFSDVNTSISFRKLYSKTQAIAKGLLRQAGVSKKNQPVVVLIDRNVDSIVAMLGVVYTGCFYVPIDRTLPVERITKIIDNLKPMAIITMDKESLSFPEYKKCTYTINELLQEENVEYDLEIIRNQVIDTDPLYAIFTSGSTGDPKGVLVSHRSVIDLIDNFKEEFHLNEETVLANQAPFDFDVSVKDIYSTLKNGATMHIVPKILFVSPANLIPYLNECKVNTIIWAVSALRIIENFKIFGEMLPEYLHTVMFSGEVMPNRVLNYWRRYLPDVAYINLYGPTEITCNCTFYKVDRDYKDEDKLPIGKPFKNTDVFILNEENALAQSGELGEICVRGTSLALGYYNNPERTEEAFCQNPLNPYYPEKIYRTGDIGYMDEEGLAYYVSRKDYQIKHMGHRIELGEIENLVSAVPVIDACCCLYNQAKEKIVLCYQANKKCEQEILQSLGKQLPKYMFPNKFIQVDTFPINKNGKIDRNELKERYLVK